MFALNLFDKTELLEIEIFLTIKLCTYIYTAYSCKTELFEIELFLYAELFEMKLFLT